MRLLLILSLFLGPNALSQETKTSIGFSLNPTFSSVFYQNESNFSEDEIESIESNTQGQLGLSGNFFFQYKVNEKLFITWGLGMQNYRFQRNYPMSGEPTLNWKIGYKQNYLQFSGAVKYRIIKTLYVRAGVGADILLDARLKTSNSSGYSDVGNDDANFKEAMVPVSFGLGYELKLSDQLNLMTELFSSAVVSDALNITPSANILQRKPWQLGCSIGIIRSF